MQFEGIYTPIVTPYYDDFFLNEGALKETVDLLVDAGVHGIIVAGTTGEYYAQSTEERMDMMGDALQNADSAMVVVMFLMGAATYLLQEHCVC